MFTVKITFLDEVDDYGYVSKFYDFDDINKAREFYAMKQAQYKDDSLVSVTSNCYQDFFYEKF